AAAGRRDEAAALYDQIRAADVPKAARVAAVRGAILVREAAGLPLLLELIQSNDPEMFGLSLVLVREMPGADLTKALADRLAGLPAEKQAAVVEALADRGDRAAGPAVLALAQKGPAAMRPAAFQALSRLGDASMLATLVQAAADAEGDTAQAAATALSSMPGKDVDAALVGMVAGGEAKLRRVAIEAAGRRRIAAANPALVKAATDPDPSVRQAALRALGETVALAEMPALVDLLVKSPAQERGAAEAALAAACARMSDREASSQTLAERLGQADPEVKAALLRTLGRVGGAKALEAVRASIKDPNESVRDLAVRILADWPDAAAAADLAALAKSSDNPKYKVLALRGYIRLAGQPGVPADQKLAMSKEALGLAQRDEEKKLVLGVLGGVPSPASLAMVAPFLDHPAMKDEAGAAAVAIGEKLAGRRPAEVAAAMKKVLQVSGNQDLKNRAAGILARTEKPEKK
ncbi:MAG: HEAT repeat domain-containing protein, partial [Thermoguttaceae bacterium]|nr:HEAT repeat domain-containing protein [Thermoguttaceae bacterium]